jgi:hypothetical protein
VISNIFWYDVVCTAMSKGRSYCTVHESEEYEERGEVERRAKMYSKMQLFHRIIMIHIMGGSGSILNSDVCRTNGAENRRNIGADKRISSTPESGSQAMRT